MAKRHYILPRGYTAQEIREVEEQYTIPSFTNLPSWKVASIEDVTHDLNVGFQKYLDAIGSYIEVKE